MSKGLKGKLVLAISSRALFDLSASHEVYLAHGIEAYRQYQIEHEDEVLAPGEAFALVQKLLSFNATLGRERVEVVLVSPPGPPPPPLRRSPVLRRQTAAHPVHV